MSTELILLSRVAYRDHEVTAPRLRALLALLAADLRTGCSTARLVDGLWPDEQPENPAKAVQILVSRTRSQLGADLIASTPTGYRLALAEEQVDASVVVAHAVASARRARDGEHAAALAEAEAGLACWAGPPEAEAEPGDPVAALRAERAATYRSLLRGRALALARLGRREEAVPALVTVAAQTPRDEELLLELLRCEAATAGPSAALARYEAYRQALRAELGTDPGTALQEQYRQLLQGTGPSVRHGLRYEPNPLLGRAADVSAVLAQLRTARVVSIVGTGGLGKTRLAHAVGRQAEQRVVHFVALTAVARDADVANEIASALGVGDARRAAVVPATGAAEGVAGIVAALGPGALLVLDNCEQVVAGVADLVQALVSATQDLRVLVTSRSPLGLSSESVYLLAQLDGASAVDLFSQRASAARPDVELPADVVADVVQHLDGLPLAIELAAARVRVMSVVEIRQRLSDRFALLRGGPRDAPERHRTLHAVVDWSWNMLDPVDQEAWAALSVFPAGFTAQAAQALLGADALAVVEQLIDQSLVKAADTPAGTRFLMLETVREFGAARLAESGRADQVGTAFRGWARDFGLRHHDSLYGADPYSTVELLRADQDNLLLALRQAVEREDGATVAASCAVLQSLWTLESNYVRMAQVADETGYVLSHYRPTAELVDVTRSTLAIAVTYAYLIQGPRAVRTLVALRRLPPAPPTTLTRAAAVVVLAAAADPAALLALCDVDEPLVAGAASGVVSYIWENAGDLDRALAASERMVELFAPRSMPWLTAVGRARIAELCLQLERGDAALRQLAAAIPVAERLGAVGDVIGLRWWMVLANLQRGTVDEAEHWLEQTSATRRDEPAAHTYGLGVRAEITLARGQVEAGLALWREALAALDDVRDPAVRRFSADVDPWTLEARAVAVVAHARHGRLAPVADVAAALPRYLSVILSEPVENPPPYLMEFPVCGAVLLALASVDLAESPVSPARARTAARMIALAERYQYLRAFQPTMSSTLARAAAEQADRPAYDDAVSSYADLDRDGLRAAGLALLGTRAAG